MKSHRRLVAPGILLLTAACSTPSYQDEIPFNDEGCIIDVRPKAKLGVKEADTVREDHWAVVEYEPLQEPLNMAAPQFGIVLHLEVDGDAKEKTFVGTFRGQTAVALPAGKNRIVLEFKNDEILLHHPAVKDPIKNDQPNKPIPDKNKHIEWPVLSFHENGKVVRVTFTAYGFETGLTIHGYDMLLKPRWKKYDRRS